MSSFTWSGFGTTPCPRCGASVPTAELRGGRHVCGVSSDEPSLADQATEFLAGRRGRALSEFERWCREHGR